MPTGRIVITVGVLVLLILHQDWWLWDDRTLVFGFMPSGLAYHVGYSIAAASLWALAVRIAWPSELEAWADELHRDESDGGAPQPDDVATKAQD